MSIWTFQVSCEIASILNSRIVIEVDFEDGEVTAYNNESFNYSFKYTSYKHLCTVSIEGVKGDSPFQKKGVKISPSYFQVKNINCQYHCFLLKKGQFNCKPAPFSIGSLRNPSNYTIFTV